MNPQQAWQATLGQLQMEMNKASFETWVKDAQLISVEGSDFIIGVPNAYARDWLESRLTATVQRILEGLMGATPAVKFIVWHRDEVDMPEEEVPEESHQQAFLRSGTSTINSRYTFDNFIVGASNRMAHAACMAVAESPAKAYNPLFLYGGVGLGKTHLLHAIGNAAQSRGLQVLYVSSEEFTNDLINAIRSHTTQAFRERYRNMDVLLIDDIQFIAGKESTQEEFFHTFNTLHGQDKQIVISSDRSPKALVTLEERLRSRFEWGLTVDIQPPDLETRIAILRSKAERNNKEVPYPILESIARLVQSNIRELEGALTRVLAFSDLSGMPLSPQLVHTALADMLPNRTHLDSSQVLEVVASEFGISLDELVGRSRSREVALPRQVAMYLMREEANASLPQIGEALGGRDHTTVMYACEKVADMIERDDRLRRKIFAIRERLYGRATVMA
ncbi:chromosomal replication initiator protein DnaA [Anaerolinea thermophila]|uniref:Chromosomal replication initiator protein DnaA n=1 Tax=Anaerolinea thermophila (strain DSM 14523 / JCM 11388 / NBRC 100420 / UNI-1) TaxID=926569 RepID=E8N670_ANATU|nr:chromosomal replication initiator protein DnaA [Anaerolinea thermophila]BAJ63934.1 chromosomal replication initiator protein DnaA [Anaerolinea thermophila UNI-1]